MHVAAIEDSTIEFLFSQKAVALSVILLLTDLLLRLQHTINQCQEEAQLEDRSMT